MVAPHHAFQHRQLLIVQGIQLKRGRLADFHEAAAEPAEAEVPDGLQAVHFPAAQVAAQHHAVLQRVALLERDLEELFQLPPLLGLLVLLPLLPGRRSSTRLPADPASLPGLR